MRFVVVGTTGAGKSTFARKLASIIGGDHVELDALHWDADWTPRTRSEFEARVAAHTTGERWVADGNYSVVRNLVWTRATDIVWLDFSRTVVFSRVIRRTLRRATLRGFVVAEGGSEPRARQGLERSAPKSPAVPTKPGFGYHTSKALASMPTRHPQLPTSA